MLSSHQITSTIDQIEALASDMTHYVQAGPPQQDLPIEKRVCKEALLTIGVLLRKLRDVQDVASLPTQPDARCRLCQDE